ncbi:uncharacterized protein LY79DRAFT_387557 [Colletotrichum navitas]|uniref:Uncharacterized protein n=1 Tax=Colletotrichum navitas TaxID=681940 RepID=A0AAD8QAK4_9PEZI|nr:uncharacterized protein LY79DRAFT_387557 [Colletotrichum navitas]KAK1597494.1 hypothetical protein LY79DRAFT_387557 [Colletotrichum navitas]
MRLSVDSQDQSYPETDHRPGQTQQPSHGRCFRAYSQGQARPSLRILTWPPLSSSASSRVQLRPGRQATHPLSIGQRHTAWGRWSCYLRLRRDGEMERREAFRFWHEDRGDARHDACRHENSANPEMQAARQLGIVAATSHCKGPRHISRLGQSPHFPPSGQALPLIPVEAHRHFFSLLKLWHGSTGPPLPRSSPN